MYLFIEKGLRGGISYIPKIYSKANNKYMKDYDPRKPSKYISYLDMNNLYGQSYLGNKIKRCLLRIFQYKHLLDFSNYPKDSKFFDPANKKVISKMKDESDGKIIGGIVGLRSKVKDCIP